MATTGGTIPFPGSGATPQTIPLRQRIWIIQVFIEAINKAIGFIKAINWQSSAKDAALILSLFLVIFPVIAFFYHLVTMHEVVVSPSFLMAFLSGLLSTKAAYILGKQTWN